jgi:hypothetical protein
VAEATPAGHVPYPFSRGVRSADDPASVSRKLPGPARSPLPAGHRGSRYWPPDAVAVVGCLCHLVPASAVWKA